MAEQGGAREDAATQGHAPEAPKSSNAPHLTPCTSNGKALAVRFAKPFAKKACVSLDCQNRAAVRHLPAPSTALFHEAAEQRQRRASGGAERVRWVAVPAHTRRAATLHINTPPLQQTPKS